jgi:hypothetical protein
MTRFSTSLLSLSILALSQPLFAEEFKTTANDQQAINLTIYNGGRALIRDTREFTLPKPSREIAFIDVSQNIMAQTVAIKGLEVREQNYDFDLLSPQALVEKNIGKNVRIARRSRDTGETLEWVEGKILSTHGGVILQMKDGSLESLNNNNSYHMVFDDIPANLRTSPTLSLSLSEQIQGQQQVEMTYLSEGLSWQSDYVLQLDESEKQAKLDSWITLHNQSGISYRDAHLQLMAGDINMQAPQPHLMRRADVLMEMAPARNGVSEESIQGYHLYTVPHKTTIKNNQNKQIKLFSAREFIKVSKRLRDKAWVDSNGLHKQKSKPEQVLMFDNKKPALGIPLPQGTVRVYGKDSAGNNQFLGEDHINHTAVNDNLEIKLGKSFDISIERQTTDHKQISKKQIYLTRKININNGSNEAQTINLTEIMPVASWRISNNSNDYDKVAPTQALFKVTVPAMSEKEMTYQVELRYP